MLGAGCRTKPGGLGRCSRGAVSFQRPTANPCTCTLPAPSHAHRPRASAPYSQYCSPRNWSPVTAARPQLNFKRLLACARNKLWWMTPEWRTDTWALPPETQFLLAEMAEGGPYALLLPLIDGDFRATLRPAARWGRGRAGCCTCAWLYSGGEGYMPVPGKLPISADNNEQCPPSVSTLLRHTNRQRSLDSRLHKAFPWHTT